MKRRVYAGLAVVLALSAAWMTLKAQHTVPVLVATHDLAADQQIGGDDVQVIRMHEDSVPTGALAAEESAIGKYAAWPLTQGEPVLGRELAVQRSGAQETAGYTIPQGYRAIAIPISPSSAVGGMLSPGDHVDVYATPLLQRSDQTALRSGIPTEAQALGTDLLVVQLRSDQGQSLDTSGTSSTVHGLNFSSGKIGSVVVAVPSSDVSRYATAAATETMYLALTVS